MSTTSLPPSTESEPRSGSPGVHAALSVLESLVGRAPLALSDLANELGVAKSTLHRVCAVLVERGWLIRDGDGRFDLGIRAIGLGARTSELPIVTAFRGVAAGLLTRHNETVALAVLDGSESVYVALEETSHPVRLVTHVGARAAAFASASGRVILAEWTPEGIVAAFGGRPLVTPTGRRLHSVAELNECLVEVRERGYAENFEETAVGLSALSVPVRNGTGVVLAALTMCVPTSRLPLERHEGIVADLRGAGERLSADVAWLPAWNATRAE
jgi:IclR family KDG regulon transcriptional repressor